MENVYIKAWKFFERRPASLQYASEAVVAKAISEAVINVDDSKNKRIWDQPQWLSLKEHLHVTMTNRVLMAVYKHIFYGDLDVDSLPSSRFPSLGHRYNTQDSLFLRDVDLHTDLKKRYDDSFHLKAWHKFVIFWLFLDELNATSMPLPPIDNHSAFYTHLLIFLSCRQTGLTLLPLMYNFILRNHFLKALQTQKQLRRIVLVGRLSDQSVWKHLAHSCKLQSLTIDKPYEHFCSNHVENFIDFLQSQSGSLLSLDATIFCNLTLLPTRLIAAIESLSVLQNLSVSDNFFRVLRDSKLKGFVMPSVLHFKLSFGSVSDSDINVLNSITRHFPNLKNVELQNVAINTQDDLKNLQPLSTILTKISCLVDFDVFTPVDVQKHFQNVVELVLFMKCEQQQPQTLHVASYMGSENDQLSFPRLELFSLFSSNRGVIMSDIDQVILSAPKLRYFNLAASDFYIEDETLWLQKLRRRQQALRMLQSFLFQIIKEDEEISTHRGVSLRMLNEIISRSQALQDVFIMAQCPEDDQSYVELKERLGASGLVSPVLLAGDDD